jgi:hypothetical protein
MIFSEKSVEGLLSGRKTQTRRLVKEHDFQRKDDGSVCNEFREGNFEIVNKELIPLFKRKWSIGKDYAVQLGRGRKGLSFRVKIVGIRKEKLLDICERDLRLEGYDNVNTFLKEFYVINQGSIKKENMPAGKGFYQYYDWNPFVWVLDLEVMK